MEEEFKKYVGKVVDIEYRVFHRQVKILKETKTGNGLKICRSYRLQGDEQWQPLITSISKKDIISIKEK